MATFMPCIGPKGCKIFQSFLFCFLKSFLLILLIFFYWSVDSTDICTWLICRKKFSSKLWLHVGVKRHPPSWKFIINAHHLYLALSSPYYFIFTVKKAVISSSRLEGVFLIYHCGLEFSTAWKEMSYKMLIVLKISPIPRFNFRWS